MAIIETLPILFVFIVLFGYGIGFFSVVHTGIMNSMASRTYAFETFRNRSDVHLFREEGEPLNYSKIGVRFHTINSELQVTKGLAEGQYATSRQISYGLRTPASPAKESDHNNKIYDIAGRNRKDGVEASPAWVMVGYGICINAKCGDR